jgi:asparagine N-glycosylation enzyme membrane subunit Stt3
MLSIPKNRIILFLTVLLVFSVIPIIGAKIIEHPSALHKAFSRIINGIFPFQLLPIICFLSFSIGLEEFWFSFTLYFVIIFLAASKAIKRDISFFSIKNIVLYFAVCFSLWAVNGAIHLYVMSNFIRALPEQPVVPPGPGMH